MDRDEDLLPHVLDVGLGHAEVAEATEDVSGVGIEYLAQGREIGIGHAEPCAGAVEFSCVFIP